MAAGRDFVLGRLAGVRSTLLGPGGLRDLVGRASAAERLGALRSTAWAAAADAGSPAEAESALESRARRAVAASLRDLPAGARALVLAYLLPEDARALRGALRAVAGALPPERAATMLEPSPSLGLERLREISSCRDATAVDARLATWGSPFTGAAVAAGPDLRKPGALAVVEVAVDAAATRCTLRAARGPGDDRRALRELCAARADLSAAATLLALSGEVERDALPVLGGDRLGPAEVARISSLPAAEVPAALARALRHLLGGAGDPVQALGHPAIADHLLGRAAVRHARQVARRFPLSIAAPCAFAAEVMEELRRIRLVLRATAEGYPPAALLDALEA